MVWPNFAWLQPGGRSHPQIRRCLSVSEGLSPNRLRYSTAKRHMGEAPAHRDRGPRCRLPRPAAAPPAPWRIARCAGSGSATPPWCRGSVAARCGRPHEPRVDRFIALRARSRIADRDPLIEQRLGDAVFRLRRARKYCRQDLVGLARLDYEALIDGRYGRGRYIDGRE
jgi:hypothetical protein